MKKGTIVTGIVTAALVFSVGSASVFAAEPVKGGNFKDSNGDGVCDYFMERGAHCAGSGYVDEDQNGVCDNYESRTCYGNGRGRHNGYGRGRGCNGGGTGGCYRN